MAAFSEAFKTLLEQNSVSQAKAAKILGRTSPYAADRYRGYRSWTFTDVDRLAPYVGCRNVFEVVRKVHGMIQADEAEKAKPQPEARPSVAVSSPDEVEDVLKHVRKGDYTTVAWDEDERTKEYYESEHDDD